MLVTSLRCIPLKCIPEVNCLFLVRRGRSKSHKVVKEVTLAWAVRFSTIPMIPMGWLCFYRVVWQYRPHSSLQPLVLCWVFTQVTVHLHGFQWDCAEGHKHRRALVPIPDLKAPLHDVYWHCSQCWQECVSLKEQQKALHLAAWPCHPIWIKSVCFLTD